MTTLLILLVAMIASLALHAYFQQLGARWVGSKKATYARGLLAVVLITLLGLVPPSAVMALRNSSAIAALVAGLLLALAGLAGSWLIIQWVFKISFGSAFLAWLASQISTVILMLLTAFVFRPWVLEAYKTPTNAMAPTIAGDHYPALCPHCGGRAIVPASAVDHGRTEEQGMYRGICQDCLQAGTTDVSGSMRRGDRIIVNKLLAARRWDLIVFRYPEDPSIPYVKRLVGLPGETVFIRDGQVWIDGQAMTPPPPLTDLRYVSEIDDLGVDYGKEVDPFQLGDDEYFVLGDFSEASSDSRFWGAVPRENLMGVATILYWPPQRWTIWR